MADAYACVPDAPDLPWGVFVVEPGGKVAPGASASAFRLLGDAVSPGVAWPDDGEVELEFEGRALRARPLGDGVWIVEDRSAEVSALRRAEVSELRVDLLRQWDAFTGFVEAALPSIEEAKAASPEDTRAVVARLETTARAFGLAEVGEVAASLRAKASIDRDDLDELAAALWTFIDDHAEALEFDPNRLEAQRGAEPQGTGPGRAERARFRPVRQLLGPVEAVVSRVAEQYGRRVELRVEGEETAVEPGLMQPVLRALGPLLENAVVHGIEAPEERGEKPEVGEIVLRFSEDDDAWRASVEDDGRGLDLEGLAERARERGLLGAGPIEALGPRGRVALAFLAGIATGQGETAGLAAVKDALDDVCATLEVRTRTGRGTTFSARVPKPCTFTAGVKTHDIFEELIRSTTSVRARGTRGSQGAQERDEVGELGVVEVGDRAVATPPAGGIEAVEDGLGAAVVHVGCPDGQPR